MPLRVLVSTYALATHVRGRGQEEGGVPEGKKTSPLLAVCSINRYEFCCSGQISKSGSGSNNGSIQYKYQNTFDCLWVQHDNQARLVSLGIIGLQTNISNELYIGGPRAWFQAVRNRRGNNSDARRDSLNWFGSDFLPQQKVSELGGRTP